ncbi:FxsA family protein [Paracoccus sp. ME4]|uniref:FxsA family protein n=1 Tax=Paracoccus sp. ME4 TaxID=3138066 RepID=UPI00398AF7C2
MRLIAMFLVVPIIEIALFIQVGGLIGLWPTLGLVVLSAVLGVSLIRGQGARAGLEVQRSLAEMRDPMRPMADGAMVIVAGLLLLIPGFFSDILGLALLVPGVRRLLMARIARRVTTTRGMPRREPHRPPYEAGVIDGDYVVADDGGSPRAPVDLPPELGDVPPPPGRGTGRGSGWTRH